MLQVEFLMSWENENEKENIVFCLQNISLFRILVETWRIMFKAMYVPKFKHQSKQKNFETENGLRW